MPMVTINAALTIGRRRCRHPITLDGGAGDGLRYCLHHYLQIFYFYDRSKHDRQSNRNTGIHRHRARLAHPQPRLRDTSTGPQMAGPQIDLPALALFEGARSATRTWGLAPVDAIVITLNALGILAGALDSAISAIKQRLDRADMNHASVRPRPASQTAPRA